MHIAALRLAEPITDGVVSLRRFTMDDVPVLTQACQDPEISRWTLRVPYPYSEEDARRWISTHDDLWNSRQAVPLAIDEVETSSFCGSISLDDLRWEDRSCAVGYWIARWARRRGYATRALVMTCDWAFDATGIETIELSTLDGNAPSQEVAKRAGFAPAGEVADHSHPSQRERAYTAQRWVRSKG